MELIKTQNIGKKKLQKIIKQTIINISKLSHSRN